MMETFETAIIEEKNEVKINKTKNKKISDQIAKYFIYLFSTLTFVILELIVFFVIYKSVDFFKTVNFFDFMFGKSWNPTGGSTDATGSYGIWKIIFSTFIVLVIALAFAVPLALFSSLFICEYLSPRKKQLVTNIVQLLAGIPSVVFGLFSITTLGPIFMKIGAPTDGNLLVTAITLAFMSLPVIISLSINAIDAVPESYRYASLALGLSKSYTTFSIIRKVATSKITGAVIMGIARIIGETMAVIMIAGNSSKGIDYENGFLDFIFSSIRTLAGTIGLEMQENGGAIHESALYAIGLILFILVSIINIVILFIQSMHKRKINFHQKRKTNLTSKRKSFQATKFSDEQITGIIWSKIENHGKRKIANGARVFFMISSTIIVVSFTLWIIGTILIRGLINLNFSHLVSTKGKSGLFALFSTTMLLVLASVVISIPLGLIVAIYLNEYAQNSWFSKVLRFSIDILASTPSIIFGTFGLAVFIGLLGMPLSILTSGLTLTVVVLPLIIKSIEDALKSVPDAYRQASLALGAGKFETIYKVVLPSATKGIVTAIILTISRIIGESAPVYLTLGTMVKMPHEGLYSPGATMTTQILMLTNEGTGAEAMQIAYEIAFLIMVMTLSLNYLARGLSNWFSPVYKYTPFKIKWKNRINYLKEKFSKDNIKKNWKKFTFFFKKYKIKKTSKEDKEREKE